MPVQDIGAIYTPSIFGRTSFPLKHKGDPIFYKKFDAANSAVVSLSQDSIYIQNHFFKVTRIFSKLYFIFENICIIFKIIEIMFFI